MNILRNCDTIAECDNITSEICFPNQIQTAYLTKYVIKFLSTPNDLFLKLDSPINGTSCQIQNFANGEYYAWTDSKCEMDECLEYTTCQTCIANGCGLCDGVCTSGNDMLVVIVHIAQETKTDQIILCVTNGNSFQIIAP